MNISHCSICLPIFAAGFLAASSPSSEAVTLLSQNFDTDPVNYTLLPGSEFVQDAGDPTKYWNLSNAVGASLNPAITGNATTYLTGQNMDAPLLFTTGTPAQVDFAVNAASFTTLTLAIDLAGLSSPEPENYVRVLMDSDNDGFHETQIFNFAGTGNLPYTETTSGQQLTAEFTPFNFALPLPAAADGVLRLRLEVFNDTNSLNEAVGIDNIRIEGIPEPATGLMVLTGLLGLARRRRAL